MIDSVAVIGLGLMGGSFARDLHARGLRVLGFDSEQATLDAARAEGVIEPMTANLDGIESVDAVVLAVPVSAAPALLTKAAHRLRGTRLITDLGSTKRSIAQAIQAVGLSDRFVGSHPFTGDHRSGWAASRTGLYRDAHVFLCPTPDTTDEALSLASAFWSSVGGNTEVLSAEDHDRRLAYASHVPQIAATALARVLAGVDIGANQLGPGGRSMTRLAGSDPDIWTAIALDNSDEIRRAVADLQHFVADAFSALEAKDADAVRAFFASGREWSSR